MDIERINDNTFKVYISYIDIEERGFSRDEIWFNKDKSEQLFWEMMDEVHDDDHFEELDGPLWIQVHAMEKGLEVIVTKNGNDIKISIRIIIWIWMNVQSKILKMVYLVQSVHMNLMIFLVYMEDLEEIPSEYTFVFENFDDIFTLAKKLGEAIVFLIISILL